MVKELIHSVTAKDCKFIITKGSGKGGQKKNKTSSAVYCQHPPSGAQGYAEDHRQQRRNKELAFKRMADTKEFKHWLKLEISRITGDEAEIESKVERAMSSHNLLIEGIAENGKWSEIG